MNLQKTLRIRRTTDAAPLAELRRLQPIFADFADAELRVQIALTATPGQPVAITLEVEGDRARDFLRAMARATPSVRYLAASAEAHGSLPVEVDYVPTSPSLLIANQPVEQLPWLEVAESLARAGRAARIVVSVESLAPGDASTAIHGAVVANTFAMISDVLVAAPQQTPSFRAQGEDPSADGLKVGTLFRVRVHLEAATPADSAALDALVRARLPLRRSLGPVDEPRRLVHASNVALLLQLPRIDREQYALEPEATPALVEPLALPTSGARLGVVDGAGEPRPLFLASRELAEHTFIIGKTGCGKTTLVETMAASEIEAGERAVVIIDPHGDMVQRLLEWVPPEHAHRVLYFDLGRDDQFLGLNLFDAETEGDRAHAIQEIDLLFLQMFGPEIWGPRIQDLFRCIANLLCHDEDGPATLIDVLWAIMLGNETVLARWKRVADRIDSVTLELFLEQILLTRKRDGSIEEITPYFRAKLSFLADSLHTRCTLGQARSTVDFRALFADRAVVLINLSKGRLSERTTSILGRVLSIRILQAAMANLDLPREERPGLSLYIDEFQNVLSPTLETILAEARKVNLSLVLANQFLDQLGGRGFDVHRGVDLAAAITGNVGTIASFRVSPADATRLAACHGRPALADALTALPKYHAICTVPSAPGSPVLCTTTPLTVHPDAGKRAEIERRSLAAHFRPREAIETEIRDRFRSRTGVVKVPKDPFAGLSSGGSKRP